MVLKVNRARFILSINSSPSFISIIVVSKLMKNTEIVLLPLKNLSKISIPLSIIDENRGYVYLFNGYSKDILKNIS